MQLDTANQFQSFLFTKEEFEQAKIVPPLFYALLQTRIADAARAVVEFSYSDKTDLQSAVIEHERLKARVTALTELMYELTPPTEFN